MRRSSASSGRIKGQPTRSRSPASREMSERGRSSSAPFVALVAAGLVGWSFYIGMLVGKGRFDRAAGEGNDGGSGVTTGISVRLEERPTGESAKSVAPRRNDLRARYRQLNMIGFESDPGEEGRWKTCRSFEEKDLVKHKEKNDKGFDPFLRMVKPKPGAAWDFSITEDQDAELLGLHQWDDRYEYGSAEADRRVKKLGYCRVHMPSVPRTGSTWFRAMFETATGQPSFSMWQEGGTFKEKYLAFSSDDPCGASLDHMEGRLTSKQKFPCRGVRPPNATSPILYKSHTPFFPSYNKPSLMPEETCMLILLVRNPIDNQDAWMRYMAGKGQMMREYLPVWQGHISHWIASAGDIPIYVFRYEDMLYRAEDVLRRVLEILPGGWNWSEESIAKAMRMFGPKRAFSDKCGAGLKVSSVAEVEMVRKHYGNFLRHFGYRFIAKSSAPSS